ncbi:MAG: hypothetical protein ACOC0S_04090 [Desulfohalobiaceae bacterium]
MSRQYCFNENPAVTIQHLMNKSGGDIHDKKVKWESGGFPCPPIARFVRSDKPTVYHVISRTALPGLLNKDAYK